jgi:hypothetical protein
VAIVGAADIRRECEATLRANGIVGRHVRSGACIGYEYAIPSQRGVLRVRTWVSPPIEVGYEYDEVGRRRRGRFRKRLKKAAKRFKKVVKSKAFKTLAKVVAQTAASALPGGAAVVTAANVAAKAARAIKRAKQARIMGDDTPMRALPRALQLGAAEIRAARLAGIRG